MSEGDDIDGLTVSSPLFLLSASMHCWQCGRSTKVVALATQNLVIPDPDEEVPEGEGSLLSYISDLPDELLAEILTRHQSFEIQHGVIMDERYYMSVCRCGAHQGDFYIHQAITDLAFRDPAALTVERLPLNGTWVLDCGYSPSDAVGWLLSAHT